MLHVYYVHRITSVYRQCNSCEILFHPTYVQASNVVWNWILLSNFCISSSMVCNIGSIGGKYQLTHYPGSYRILSWGGGGE